MARHPDFWGRGRRRVRRGWVGGALSALSAALGLGGGGRKGTGSETPLEIRIINQTSQPAQATSATQGGLDGEFKDSVISVVLENASQGGALASLFAGL